MVDVDVVHFRIDLTAADQTVRLLLIELCTIPPSFSNLTQRVLAVLCRLSAVILYVHAL